MAGRRCRGEVNRRCVGESASPRLLDVHSEPDFDAQVANTTSLCQTADTVDFEPDALTCAVSSRPEHVLIGLDHLVEKDGLPGHLSHVEILFVGLTRLFEVGVDIPGLVHDPDGVVGQPGTVGIEGHGVRRRKEVADRLDPSDIVCHTRPDLRRMNAIATGTGLLDRGDHLVGCAGWDRRLHDNLFPGITPEELRHRAATHLAADVVTGYVNGGFHIRMPGQGDVHHSIELIGMGWIQTQHSRRQLLDSSPNPPWKGGQICRSPWARLTPALNTGVSCDSDESAVEFLEVKPTAGQRIGMGKRQRVLVDGDLDNPHPSESYRCDAPLGGARRVSPGGSDTSRRTRATKACYPESGRQPSRQSSSPGRRCCRW